MMKSPDYLLEFLANMYRPTMTLIWLSQPG